MRQPVGQRLVRDELAPLPDGAQAPQVAGRVEGRVGRLGQVDLGDVDGREGRQGRDGHRGRGGAARGPVHGTRPHGGGRLEARTARLERGAGQRRVELLGGARREGRGLGFAGEEAHGGLRIDAGLLELGVQSPCRQRPRRRGGAAVDWRAGAAECRSGCSSQLSMPRRLGSGSRRPGG